MTKKHQKHTKLIRPDMGQFGRNEWAIIGTPCNRIQEIVRAIINSLSGQYKIAYIDAAHKPTDRQQANLSYTDKQNNLHHFSYQSELNSYQLRPFFNEQDILLVNGNHFVGQRQIVVIDKRKRDSLARKLDRLTDVQLILLNDETETIPDYLSEHLPNINNIPTFKATDYQKISDFIYQKTLAKKPPLSGLVLAGGKSTRMGQDKGAINYHGLPQREYLHQLLTPFCETVYLSCRSQKQADGLTTTAPILLDKFTDLGPFGAILSAFRFQPNHAWLVVACDLPLLDTPTLQYLNDNRQPSALATAFHNPATNFPEPLITIWEPKSYPTLLHFLAQGYSCPRKVLINSVIHTLQLTDTSVLKNVNTPEELGKLKILK